MFVFSSHSTVAQYGTCGDVGVASDDIVTIRHPGHRNIDHVVEGERTRVVSSVPGFLAADGRYRVLFALEQAWALGITGSDVPQAKFALTPSGIA